MQYEIEIKLHRAREGKVVTPDNVDLLLAAAQEWTNVAADSIDALEKLDQAGLACNAEEILDLWYQVSPTVAIQPPEGYGHEPQVIAYHQWWLANGESILTKLQAIGHNDPKRAVARLSRLVDALPAAILAARVAEHDGRQREEAALARLCEHLGLKPNAAITEISDRWDAEVTRWEAASPLSLSKERPAIFCMHDALESAMLFSPLAAAVVNGTAHPRAPRNWQEELICALGPERWKRFAKVFGTTVRAVYAEGVLSETNERAGKVRWDRLLPVKELAFRLRAERPRVSRNAAIKGMLTQIREAARNAGEPLTGDDDAVLETVTRWFRKAGIK